MEIETERKENLCKSQSAQTPTKEMQKMPMSHYKYSPLTWLLVISHPCHEVWVCVCIEAPDPTHRKEQRKKEKSLATRQMRVDDQWIPLIDVRLHRELIWIASGVYILWSLARPHIVNKHGRREA